MCAAWSFDDPFVLAEIEAHWRMTEIRLACHWLDKHPFPRSIAGFAAELHSREFPNDQVHAMYHALAETRMVICTNCYSAPSDTDSMSSILEAIGILARRGVSPPRLEPFAHATWSGEFSSHGVGKSFGRESCLDRRRDD